MIAKILLFLISDDWQALTVNQPLPRNKLVPLLLCGQKAFLALRLSSCCCSYSSFDDDCQRDLLKSKVISPKNPPSWCWFCAFASPSTSRLYYMNVVLGDSLGEKDQGRRQPFAHTKKEKAQYQSSSEMRKCLFIAAVAFLCEIKRKQFFHSFVATLFLHNRVSK